MALFQYNTINLPLPGGFTEAKGEIPSSNAIAQLAIQVDYLATGRIAG
jgi:hypothetical protein